MEEVLSRDVQFVLLGTGDPPYQGFLRDIAENDIESARVVSGFDDAPAHRIEAGSGAFLMPLQYRPSVVNQIYSLKYGTLPIVRSTSSLRDSVSNRNAFVFERYTPVALLDIRRNFCTRLMHNAMHCDPSGDRSVNTYVSLYRRLLPQ